LPRDVPTKREVHGALERAAQLLKRQQREARELLATVRHAQAHLLGIDVETLTPQSPNGGHSDDTCNETEAPST
jgi:hypothetical protein